MQAIEATPEQLARIDEIGSRLKAMFSEPTRAALERGDQASMMPPRPAPEKGKTPRRSQAI
jgi:hypothetical protein